MFLGVTIGFVNERETFTEPTTGVSQSREMICVEVKDGRVGTPLIIVPVWTAGTATGDPKALIMYYT